VRERLELAVGGIDCCAKPCRANRGDCSRRDKARNHRDSDQPLKPLVAFVSAFLASWFAGAIVYRSIGSRFAGSYRSNMSAADLAFVGAWTFGALMFCAPLFLRIVSRFADSRTPFPFRLAGGLFWTLAIAIGISAVLSALLGRGRVFDVATQEGLLLLAWVSTMSLVFVLLGAVGSRIGWWLDLKDN